MRVAVTGSSGFIGRHMVTTLLERGFEVLGVDLEPATQQAVEHDSVVCDIRSTEALTNAFRRFEPAAVVHLAARTDLQGRDAAAYSANTEGTRSVISAIRATPTVRRLICTSSQLVCRIGSAPAHDEDFTPDTAYGSSKAAAERICRAEDGGGTQWCIVRPTTIWGPGMNPHYLRFFRLLRRGLYFHIGKQAPLKSYGYVGNTVHQYLQLLRAPGEQIHRHVFYLADYVPLDLSEWAEAFRLVLGAPRIRRVPTGIAVVGARIGDAINRLGGSTPLNSFRLRNVLTSCRFDLRATENVCGPLPYDMHAGVMQTARWLETVL